MRRTWIVMGIVILGLVVTVPMAQGFAFGAAAQRGGVALSHLLSTVASFVTPEPTSLILVGMGGLMLLGAARRRKTA